MEIKEPEDSRGMIRFKMDGKDYGLHFRHRKMKTIVRGKEDNVVLTRAGIYHLPVNDETGPPILINYGVAKCSKKDNFCRETGRKIALTRALLGGMHEFATSKDKRELVWKAYFGRIPVITPEPAPTADQPVLEGIVVDEQKLLESHLDTIH